jgi:hypothetical protein
VKTKTSAPAGVPGSAAAEKVKGARPAKGLGLGDLPAGFVSNPRGGPSMTFPRAKAPEVKR